MEKSDIKLRFSTYGVTKEQFELIDVLTKKFQEMALEVNKFVPGSREQTISIERLEEAMLWAIEGIARNDY